MCNLCERMHSDWVPNMRITVADIHLLCIYVFRVTHDYRYIGSITVSVHRIKTVFPIRKATKNLLSKNFVNKKQCIKSHASLVVHSLDHNRIS